MRVPLETLCKNLGINRALSPYEVQPWAHCDEDKGTTCSAEAHMGPDTSELGAEIQMLKEEGQDECAVPEQIFFMRAAPNSGLWEIVELKVKSQDYVNKFTDWDEKACNFFRACTKALEREEIPDIDKLLEEELSEDDMFGGRGGRRGRAGKKSPKINPASLLGVKKGM